MPLQAAEALPFPMLGQILFTAVAFIGDANLILIAGKFFNGNFHSVSGGL